MTEVMEQKIQDVIEAGILKAMQKYGLDKFIEGRFTPGIGPEEKKAPGAFKSFGEQMQAVYKAGCPDHAIDPRLVTKATGLSEGVPSEGGFLVEPQYAAELIKRTYETGVLLGKCRHIPIDADKNGLKINAIAETSRATGSRWGGVQAYWAAEAGTKTASKPVFRQMELNLQKIIGLCYSTDELLADATALEDILMQAFPEEFGFLIDDGIIRGTGAGTLLGILNSPCLITVAAEAGQAAATIVSENIMNMWSRLWARSKGNAVWLINQDVTPQLWTMSVAVGTGGVAVYMPAGGLSGQPYATLFGRPVIEIEQCSTLGTVGDIILADLGEYLVIEKGGIESASSIHVRFIYDETAFRFVYRIDGQPAWNAALTPYQGSNTTSPFVALATRS